MLILHVCVVELSDRRRAHLRSPSAKALDATLAQFQSRTFWCAQGD